MNFDRMQDLQAHTNMDKIQEMMKSFIEEVAELQTQKRASKYHKTNDHNSATPSTDTGLQNQGFFSTIGSVLNRFGWWCWEIIKYLMWT